jgi:hypothetical protein
VCLFQFPGDHCQEGEYGRLLMLADVVLFPLPSQRAENDFQFVEQDSFSHWQLFMIPTFLIYLLAHRLKIVCIWRK